VRDEPQIVHQLKDLHSSENPTNWVLFGYSSDGQFELQGSGAGGIDEVKGHLVENQIQYVVLELTVEGDEYNPIKFVLGTWTGPKVNPGVGKARASAHRDDIFDLVKKGVAISAQHQAESLDDFTAGQFAQAISRQRPSYGGATTASEKRQVMSRSSATKGQLSTFAVVNREACEQGLRSVHEGRSDWAILAYVQGKKDEVELVKTGGGGVEGLRREFPTDRIFYALFTTILRTSTGEPISKFILITMIGASVPPLQKARSSAQRKDISDFVLSVVPLNAHLQPNDADELTEKIIAKMFHD
jgi:hypothetical protein